MQSTTNYNLNKPENTDEIKISDLNENFDKIDTELKNVNNEIDGLNENKVSTTGDVSDTIVTEYTTTQTSFPSLSVGEKLKVVFGKINKFISDVKNWKTTVDENLETNTAAIDTLNSDIEDTKAGVLNLNNDLNNKYPLNKLYPFSGTYQFDNEGKATLTFTRSLAHQYLAVLTSGGTSVSLEETTINGTKLVNSNYANKSQYIAGIIYCVY